MAMAHTVKCRFWRPLTLRELQRVKRWTEARQLQSSAEYQVWQIVLAGWLMGWIGWLPAFELDAPWAYPLCLVAMSLPRCYVYLRSQAHAACVLRCDWLEALD